MNSRIFTRALSASAVILLSAGVTAPAIAADIAPTNNGSTQATTNSESEKYSIIYDYATKVSLFPLTYEI